MNRIMLILSIVVGLLPLSSVAQENLCKKSEQTIWSCMAQKKIYSLCAPKEKSVDKSYLQYRVGMPSRIEFVFPDSLRSPVGIFKYQLYNKSASVQFENAGYQYKIYESINGEASIAVEKDGKGMSEIRCRASTDTLTLTSTIEQFKAMGIYE